MLARAIVQNIEIFVYEFSYFVKYIRLIVITDNYELRLIFRQKK